MKEPYGFTLVEVIVAFGLFGFVALGSMSFFSFGKNQTMKAKKTDHALGLAENQMVMLETQDYDSIADSSPGSIVLQKYGTDFTRFYTASQMVTYEENYKVIAVTVTWISSGGAGRAVELMTVIAPEE